MAKDYIDQCEGLINELRTICKISMYNREYSPIAKPPYKVMLFVNSMNWRMLECSEAALLLMKDDLIIPSSSLIRACWENMAITFDLKKVVEKYSHEDITSKEVDNTLMRILHANRFESENRYVGDDTFVLFKEYKATNILTLITKIEKAYPQTKDFYTTLCEFVHPNGDAVCGSYSQLDEIKDYTYFGSQQTKDTELFPAFITTLSVSISLFLSFIEDIHNNIVAFTNNYEKYLLNNTDTVN